MAHLAGASGVSAIEEYRALVDKAYNKFSRLREFPPYGRNKWEYYFHKAFQIYSKLWRFQQENRQKLVDSGLKRWEIGEIASRIGQLYHSYYLRTSDATFLCESYIFYEAILSREYFKDTSKDSSLANKQLRYYARFIVICLLLNRRDVVHLLVKQLRVLVEDFSASFESSDGKEWKIVHQEISRFMKADAPCDNTRPLRYSLLLDPRPSSLPSPAKLDGQEPLKLQDAVLASYYHSEVRFSELTLDTFRMLQAIEWEPSGSFYRAKSWDSSNVPAANGGFPGSFRLDDITDPSLPPNPHKYILYRPTVPQLLIVLATSVEELSSNCILLLYLSAAGKTGKALPSFGVSNFSSNVSHDTPAEGLPSEVVTDRTDVAGHREIQVKGGTGAGWGDGLWLGSRKNATLNYLYPSDILPFTRKPLFIVIDSDNSSAFERISGEERGEPAILLLSPTCQPSDDKGPSAASLGSGSLFTFFLTAPLLAFLRLAGVFVGQLSQATYEELEKLLADLFTKWGEMLAASTTLSPVWARVLSDPFLRQLALRFLFSRACYALHSSGVDRPESLPRCFPTLPEEFLPLASNVQAGLLKLSQNVGVADQFRFSAPCLHTDPDAGSPSVKLQVVPGNGNAYEERMPEGMLGERLSDLGLVGSEEVQ